MEGADMEAKRLTLRKATEEDIDILFELINGLATYEKRPQDMTGTKEQLKEWLFEKQVATALLAENEEGHNIGYAIYYPTFGSFSAKANVHVEDLYIRPEYRHQGYGRSFSLNWWNGFKAKATPNSNGVAWIGIPHPSNFIKNSEPAKNREGCILSWTPRIVKRNRADF